MFRKRSCTHLTALAHPRLEAGVLEDNLALVVQPDVIEVVLVCRWLVRVEELDVEDELREAGQVVLRQVARVNFGCLLNLGDALLGDAGDGTVWVSESLRS